MPCAGLWSASHPNSGQGGSCNNELRSVFTALARRLLVLELASSYVRSRSAERYDNMYCTVRLPEYKIQKRKHGVLQFQRYCTVERSSQPLPTSPSDFFTYVHKVLVLASRCISSSVYLRFTYVSYVVAKDTGIIGWAPCQQSPLQHTRWWIPHQLDLLDTHLCRPDG